MHLKADNQFEILTLALKHNYHVTIRDTEISMSDIYRMPVVYKKLCTFDANDEMVIKTPSGEVITTNVTDGFKYLYKPPYGEHAYEALCNVESKALYKVFNTRQNISFLRKKASDFHNFWRLNLSDEQLARLNSLYDEYLQTNKA